VDELVRVLLENRYLLFGLAVLAEQSGMPVPTAPVLLGAGAMIGAGEMRAEAALILAQHGFTRVRVLGGGLEAWRAAGRPLVPLDE
jgi:membrane protein DedA with SNARE-associated domain